jgi:PAS domain-containing protein
MALLRLDRSYEQVASTCGVPQHRLRVFFDDSPAAWIITDAHAVVVDANHAAELIFRRPLSAMRRTKLSGLISKADRPEFRHMAANLLFAPFAPSRPLALEPSIGANVEVVFKATMMADSTGEPEFISWMFIECSSAGDDLL